MDLAVIGLGKLGAPLAALLAARGHTVIAADVNPDVVQLVNSGQAPVVEPGLQPLLDLADGRLRATTNIAEASARADVTFILVPTPSEADGSFSMTRVLEAARAIGPSLRTTRSAPPVIVLTSTVTPGATQGCLIPALESASGLRCGDDFGVCYSPEFVSLGNVIAGMENPDFVLIGESHAWAGARLSELLGGLGGERPPVVRMSLENAELAKLAVNTYVTMKISFANMLCQLCERMPGGDVDAVTRALGHDPRIGSKYLKGALGYGGPCFPRDNLALAHFARSLGLGAPLAQATDAVNQQQLERLVELVTANLPNGGTVGIIGLAYKPMTPVVDAAPGLELARTLLDREVKVVVFDPLAHETARRHLRGDVQFADSAGECARAADFLVLATPQNEVLRFDAADLQRPGEPVVVLDCWRALDPQDFEGHCTYVALGTPTVHARLRPPASEWIATVAEQSEETRRMMSHGSR